MKLDLTKYIGVLFLVIGGLILLENLNFLQGDTGKIILAIIYSALSVFFFVQTSKNYTQWWWLVSGLFLLALALGKIIGLSPSLASYSPVFGVTGAGIGFLVVYFVDRNNWWALIPGSIFVSLGIIHSLEIRNASTPTDSILFLGLGTAFLLMFLFPNKLDKMNWALIPAVILLTTGTLSSFDQTKNAISYLVPILLFVGGGVVLYLSLRKN